MSIEQVDAPLAATSEPFKAAIVIGAGLDLRQSERAGLIVDRVDVLSALGHRRPSVAAGDWSATGVFTSPKTEACTRIVPADQWVLDHLAAQIRQHGLGTDGVLLHRNSAVRQGQVRLRATSCELRVDAHKAELHLESSLGPSEQLAGPANAARRPGRADVDALVARLGLAIERPLERRCQAGVDLAQEINS